MKKLLAITLCILALVLIVACSSKKDTAVTNTQTMDNPGEIENPDSFSFASLEELQLKIAQSNTAMSSGVDVLARVVNHTKLNFDNYSIYNTGYTKYTYSDQIGIHWHSNDCPLEFHSYSQCSGFWLDFYRSSRGAYEEMNYLDEFEQIDTDLYSKNMYNPDPNAYYANDNTLYVYRLHPNYNIEFVVNNDLENHDAVVAQFVELCEDIKSWLSDDNVAA